MTWAADSLHLVSGSLDESIVTRKLANVFGKKERTRLFKGGVTELFFASENTVIGTGADGVIKIVEILFP